MEPRTSILSSEIARLVYGYLLDVGEEVAELFLKCSPYLQDAREAVEEGVKFYTDFRGLSLKQVLVEYAFLLDIVTNQLRTLPDGYLCPETCRPTDKLCHILRCPNVPSRSRTSSLVNIARSSSSLGRPSPLRNSSQDHHENVPVSSSNSMEISPPRVPSPTNLAAETVPETESNNCQPINEPGQSPRWPPAMTAMAMSPRVFDLTIDENPARSPHTGRTFVEKKSFLNNMELEPEATSRPGQMTRSRSMGDLVGSCEKRKLRTRPKFFTPNKKRSEEPTKEAIKASLKELYANRDLHEKIAQSINQVREEISIEHECDELDNEAILSTVEKITADPEFNSIMEQTLGNFDLLAFLKPSTKPVASVKNRLRNASVSKDSKDDKSRKSKEIACSRLMSTRSKKTSLSSRASSAPVEDNSRKAEMTRPRSVIRYDPTDSNIITGSLDNDGNCVFYSDPKAPSNGILLPPAPSTSSSDAPRYRNILPKMEAVNMPLHPVVVCTPVMSVMQDVPAILPPPPPKASRTRNHQKLSKTKRATGNNTFEPPIVPHVILETPNATPMREYTDMPAVHFFATPQAPPEPTPPAPPSPMGPEITPTLPPAVVPKITPTLPPPPSPVVPKITPLQPQPSKKQSLSTPRRKSYIRNLEFETPEKPMSDKKSATSPKNRIVSTKKSPKLSCRRNLRNTPSTKPAIVSPIPEIDTSVNVQTSNESVSHETSTHSLNREPLEQNLNPEPTTQILQSEPPKQNLFPEPPQETLNSEPHSLHRRPTTTSSHPKLNSFAVQQSSSVNSDSPASCAHPKSLPYTQLSMGSTFPPIATKTPLKTKLSSAWDELGGVSCVLGQSSLAVNCDQSKSCDELGPCSPNQVNQSQSTPWDANLRLNLSASELDLSVKSPRAKKTVLKKRKTRSKKQNGTKSPPIRRLTRSKTIVSPSKISQTAKRSTYAISHGSSSAFESSSNEEDVESIVQIEMTPAKENELKNPVEETPITKLLRENVASVDIDLSMIQTPFFPPTPCPIEQFTPQHANRPTDYSSSSSYYKPDLTSPGVVGPVTLETVQELQRSEECLQDISTNSGRVLLFSPNHTHEKTGEGVENTTAIPASYNVQEEKSGGIKENDTIIPSSIDNEADKTDKSIESSTASASSFEGDTEKTVVTAKNTMVAVSTNNLQVTKPKKNDEKINQLVNEGKRIVQSRRSSGKSMSLLKMQMIAQCDSKLIENIPIADCSPQPTVVKSTLQQELEKKRLNTIDKMKDKVVSRGEKRVKKPLEKPLKRFKVSPNTATKPRSHLVCSTPNKSSQELSERLCEISLVSKSPPKTPSINLNTSHVFLAPKSSEILNLSDSIQQSPPKTPNILNHSNKSIEEVGLEVKKEIPSFVDDGELPDVSLATKKKLHVIKSILDRPEVREYLSKYPNSSSLVLKPCIYKMFKLLLKWMKKDGKHDFKSNLSVVEQVKGHLSDFQKMEESLVAKKSKKRGSNLENLFEELKKSEDYCSDDGSSIDSRVGVQWAGAKKAEVRKDAVAEERALPPKKRRKVKTKAITKDAKGSDCNIVTPTTQDSVKDAQTILQDIDVDRFLSHVHGKDNV